MNKTDLPATMFSHDGALVVVGEGVKGSIELFFATWLMGRLFPDVDPSTQSILVLANWLDAAIVVEQFQGEDSFLESTTVDDVNKWIVTGSWASLQSEREVIPSEYVGFDKVKRIHAKDEFSKLLQMRNWKSISHKSGKPEIFVASRRDFNVVTATTSISEHELLQTPHPITPEVMPPYPVTALTAEKLAESILIGHSFA